MEHTPTLQVVGNGKTIEAEDQAYWFRATVQSDNPKEDAAFIVRAVNAHEDLLDFAKRVKLELDMHGVCEYDRGYSVEDIENLIAKAEASQRSVAQEGE